MAVITFDFTKNQSNIAKHGVSLAFAEEIDWSQVRCAVDSRKDYGELREVGFAFIGTRLYCVVFTQRGETFHIISLRKANPREIKYYDYAEDD